MKDNGIHPDLIDIDDHEVREFLEAVGAKGMQRVFRVQMKASARILQNEAVQNFAREHKYKGVWKQTIRRASGKTRVKARQVARVISKIKGGEVLVKVHIMDDYRAKWFEMGTKKRTTKGRLNVGYYRLRADSNRKYVLRVGEPANRGRIEADHFFRKARRSKEQSMTQDLSKRIKKVIQKTLNNAKG